MFSCWKCLKRLFGIQEHYDDIQEEMGPLSLYILNQNQYMQEEYVDLPKIDEDKESTWSLDKNHDKSVHIKKFNSYLKKL